MKRRLSRAIAIAICLSLVGTIRAQEPQTCTVTGIIYKLDRAAASGATLKITPISVPALASTRIIPVVAGEDGSISVTLIQGSRVRIEGPVLEFNKPGGKEVNIPNSPTADLYALIGAAAVPVQGLAARDEGSLLPTKMGEVDFVGSGVTATQTAAGKMRVTIPGGGAGALALDDLVDAEITGPQSGQFPRYNGDLWINAFLSAGDIPSLDAAKITTGQFADGRIASAATWNAKLNQAAADALYAPLAHVSNTSNPHGVTKPQVGLGNVSNDAQLKIAFNLSDLNNAATARGNLGLGNSAVLDVGTTAGTVAAGNHNHSGAYEPANANIQSHISNTSNPHSVTKSQVGLASVDDVQQQPLDAELSAIAGLNSAADKFPYFTGSGTAALGDVTSFARSILGGANAGAVRSTLGLVIGTDVQAQGSYITALTGDVTASGPGSVTATIGAGKVTNSMLAGSIAVSKLAITGTPDGTKFLRDDGSWQAASGGAGTPGGSDTQVQFNDGGVFGGSSGLTFNKTTKVLTLAKDSGNPGFPTLVWPDVNGKLGFQHDEDLDPSTFYWYANFQRVAFRPNGIGHRSDGLNCYANGTSLVAATYDTCTGRSAAGVIESNSGTPGQYGDFLGRALRSNPVTFANLPASPLEGMLVAVTDSTTATWGATVTGGGSNHVLAYYNGTNWTVAAK